MTTLDILVLLLLVGGAVLGGLRGFVSEVLSLFAWAAAIFALKMLHTPVTGLLGPLIGSRGGAAVVAFVAIFGIVWFAGRMIADTLGRRTRSSILGPIDRLLGVGFGALKGLLIATVAYLALNLVFDVWAGKDAARPDWLKTSRTYPLLSASGRAIIDFVHLRRGDLKKEDYRPANAQADGKV
ncbi:CvpA family protein [Sphingomonas sp. BIUV-7]|uniref:CvpA family protein n=1 Tax=Sphingomonas natans TaxID=3063330 RepID=A0ABT8Y5J9_9SPHN|nr:CvpA family protein [Sphingomonas sp. BIUV-7]MDO6413599.1 CvpA family protein [Sphingomonas sp. BIUV-7]